MKKLITALLAVVLSLSVSACGSVDSKVATGTSGADVNSTQTVVNSSASEETSEANDSSDASEVLPKGEFDWDAVMDDFYILDIKMTYPFSENSLDDNFVFENYRHYNEPGDYYYIEVTHTSRPYLTLFHAEFKGINEDTYNSDCIVSATSYLNEASLQGITEGVSMEKVYETWGKPDEILEKTFESDDDTAVYYGNEEGQKVYIGYDNINDVVISISIDFVDMKGKS